MSNNNSNLDWVSPNQEWVEKWNDVDNPKSRYYRMSHHEFAPTLHTSITLTVHHKENGKVNRGKVSLSFYGHSLAEFNIDEPMTLDEMKKQAYKVCLEWIEIRHGRFGQLIDILSSKL